MKLGEKNGMVMALSLFHQGQTLTLVAGYENGTATVAQLGDHGNWTVRYQAKCHSQPILSLDVSPNRDFFLTSSADAIIAKHPLPSPSQATTPPSRQDTTALTTTAQTTTPSPSTTGTKSLLSTALSQQQSPSPNSPSPTQPATTTADTLQTTTTTPLKTINTKHAGQQSLRIRSDARLFATAGWDAKVRVYSARTLAEVAVLKWHTVGCYATAFAEVTTGEPQGDGSSNSNNGGGGGVTQGGGGLGEAAGESAKVQDEDETGREVVPVPKLVEMTVREKRERQARTAHWLVAGSKDGKVSLWDVF